MQKLIDFILICIYLIKNNWQLILITTLICLICAIIFFIIDFNVWNKTHKSLWHKIIK